jgi:anti-anti-sigma regulatory factor
MLSLHVENIADISIVECEGRIVRSEAALKLREVVTSQRNARTVVLDLSEVSAIEAGGLGMLWFLLRWANEHAIRLKLFNPTNFVRERLQQASSMLQFDIATREEMMVMLALAYSRNTLAA